MRRIFCGTDWADIFWVVVNSPLLEFHTAGTSSSVTYPCPNRTSANDLVMTTPVQQGSTRHLTAMSDVSDTFLQDGAVKTTSKHRSRSCSPPLFSSVTKTSSLLSLSLLSDSMQLLLPIATAFKCLDFFSVTKFYFFLAATFSFGFVLAFLCFKSIFVVGTVFQVMLSNVLLARVLDAVSFAVPFAIL